MALALYRKYRPRTFAEVIGQEHVTEPLSQALRTGRLHHAYLFSGPRGCGKTSSARIMARSLNCAQGPTPQPCGECESCRSLANDGAGSIDVIEIDAASHGGVDDARELRERAFFAPVNSPYKIYVIDEAHMVSTQGFNALLKLVEEPPEYVKFIFATTEPEKVLGTIRSRTHHYPFRLIPPAVLRPYLEQLCQAEGVTVDPTVFPLVVRAGGGSARDSLSVLDQLIAGAGDEGVSYARAVALLGVTDANLIDEMCDAIAAEDGAAAYATIDRVADAGHDPRRFASDLLERLRDLIILRQVPDAVAKGLIDGPADQIERMSAQAQRMGTATLSRCADILHNGLVEMRGTTGPRLLLELVCARMLLPGAEDSTGALLQRLERLERRLALGTAASAEPDRQPAVRDPAVPVAAEPGAAPLPAPAPQAGAPPAPAAAATPADAAPAVAVARPPAAVPDVPAAVPAEAIMPDPATPEPERPGAAPAAVLDAAGVRRVWDEVLTLVSRTSKVAAAYLREATVREVLDDALVLTFRHHMHANRFTASPELLVDALYDVLGVRWEIRCEVAGEQGGAVHTPPRPQAPQPAHPAQAAHPAPQARPAAAQVGSGQRPGPQRTPGRPSATDRSGPTERAGGGPSGGQPSGSATVPGAGTANGDDDNDNDWPEPARPGGGEAPAPGPVGTSEVAAQPVASGRTLVAPPSRASGPAAAPGTPRAPITPSAAGSPTPRGPGGVRPGGPGRPTGDAGSTGAAWGDGSPLPEPPDEATEYEGFDPGDEPLDDVVDEQTARQSSEQQALQLLQEKLGAEKIAEIDAR